MRSIVAVLLVLAYCEYFIAIPFYLLLFYSSTTFQVNEVSFIWL
jgi:hypothetical protein